MTMPDTQTLMRTLLVVLALPVLWFFAPIQLHGHTGYAIVDGISMEPSYHGGDLVLIHEQPRYSVGEVVAYHSRKSGVVVLHRIARMTADGRYVFKGDNNSFFDPPAKAQDLIGAKWLRAPKVGAAMVWVRKPWHEILLVGVAVLLGLFSKVAPQRAGGSRTSRTSPPDEPRRLTRRAPASQIQLLAAIAFALVAGLWLIALGTPNTKSDADPRLFQERGAFTVSGRAAKSSVYPDGRLHPGDTIFTRLVRTLDVTFDYGVASHLATSAAGSAELSLDLSSDNGWHTLQTLATTPLRASRARLSARLDIAGLQRTAHAVDEQTGVPSSSYTLELVARVNAKGRAGTTPIGSTFSPRLTYRLDANRLLLVQSPATSNPFVQTKDGAGLVNRPNAFHLGPAAVDVRTLRTLAGWGTAFAFVALAAAAAFARTRNDEPARLAWQYRDWLIPIKQLPHTTSVVTDVTEFDSLVRLADRHNKAILHLDAAGEHTYLVKENGLLYRYTALDGGMQRRTVRPAAPDLPGSV
ncbi:MAG: signal peptidase [Gaiellaceae bacterium]|jgi:signal peptidase I|nr:signal peptidase [Gaiellaceae bacterium]